MNAKRLQELVKSHGLEIDDYHGGAGKFRDVYIGTGAPYKILKETQKAIQEETFVEVVISTVTNKECADYGSTMLEVRSFWWDEDDASD